MGLFNEGFLVLLTCFDFNQEKKLLASKGLIDYEEDMKDVALPSPGRQRVMTACIPSDEILAAAAAGPGTTLGGPQ